MIVMYLNVNRTATAALITAIAYSGGVVLLSFGSVTVIGRTVTADVFG